MSGLLLSFVWGAVTLLPLLLDRRGHRLAGRLATVLLSGRRTSIPVVLTIALLLPGLPPPPTAAAMLGVFNVTRFDDPTPIPVCQPSDCSLRAAVGAANLAPGSIIQLQAGTYMLQIPYNAAIECPSADPNAFNCPQDNSVGDLDIRANVTIYGSSFGSTIIDGGGVDRVFDICCQTTVVSMSYLTIRGGNAGPDHPGFYGHGHGGGIHNHAQLLLQNVTITGNTVADTTGKWGGGGITNGCGVTLFPGSPCTSRHGYGKLTMTNATISGNSLTGSSVKGGGGLENGAEVSLNNVTITNNTSPVGKGGGVYNNAATGGFVSVHNTIIAANPSGDNCVGPVNSQENSLSSDITCAGLTNADARLGPLRDNGGTTFTHALGRGSAALDAGGNTGCASQDQRGIARPQDADLDGTATCDIGAYELEPVDLAITYLADSPDPVVAGQLLIYSIDVRDLGAAGATGLRLIDTLPLGVTFDTYADTRDGTCAHSGGVVTCDLDSLRSGFVWTVYLYVTVSPTTTGTLTITASVTGAGGDPNPANNTLTETTAVTAVPTPSPTPTPTPSPTPAPSPTPTPAPAPATRALTVATTGVGSVTPGGVYATGSTATLTAEPAAGSIFTGWTVDGRFQGWANPLTLTMDRDHTVAAVFAPAVAFADVPAGQAYSLAITELAARGYIQGYGDGTYGPNDRTRRAQMAALIARAMGYGDAPTNPFTDRCAPGGGDCVDDELWKRVAELAARNIAKGYTDAGTCGASGVPCYAPRDFVLHAQVLSFITRAMVGKGYWAQQPINAGLYGGVLNGTGHEQDVATYAFYTAGAGGVPDYPASGGFAAWDRPATRGWFARALWAALDSHLKVDHTP